jgi:hypothetical protein
VAEDTEITTVALLRFSLRLCVSAVKFLIFNFHGRKNISPQRRRDAEKGLEDGPVR